MLAESIPFDPANPAVALAQLPAEAGIYALFGVDAKAEPYLSRTPNLRRRLQRFLRAQPGQSRRLQLAEKVVRIEYTRTGSDFEAWLVLYRASLAAFGERAHKRLHLRAPAFLRMSMQNEFPRAYVTTKITRSAAASLFGPFGSRAAAERFLDEALNLFLLRRCTEDLRPDPVFPGCVYGEMKKCMAPCNCQSTHAEYAAEAQRVFDFFSTRGKSLLEALEAERDAASNDLDFERAAAVHARIQRVETVEALAGEAVRPLAGLRALIVQPAAGPEQVALFLLDRGWLTGPAFFSVAGMRHPNEQSGSSSLFAHPVALAPVPLEAGAGQPAARDVLEGRLQEALVALEAAVIVQRSDSQALADHLCLFTRWYHRSAARRVGEIFFLEPGSEVPAKAVLRGVSRVFRAGNVVVSS